MYGTHFGEPGIMVGNINEKPGLVTGLNKFVQTIYFNPLAVSGNFVFRTRIWWYHLHVPASNTTGDFLSKIYVDYEDNGDLWEYIPSEDRTTGAWDYKSFVESWIKKCDQEKIKEDLTDEEYYDRLYNCHIKVNIYLTNTNRSISLYPDHLDALHEQEVEGRLGHDINNIRINVIFPKLRKMSQDLLYNFTHTEGYLFYECDRLRFLPEGALDTLVDQRTLEYFFAYSAIQNISSTAFRKMTNVVSTEYAFAYTNLKVVPSGLFRTFKNIQNMYSTFYHCKDLLKIENTLIENTLSDNININSIFSECTSLRIPYGFKFKHVFPVTSYLKTWDMLGNVIVHNLDPELLEGLNYDGMPTNAIYRPNAETDTTGMNGIELIYTVNESISIDSVRLCLSTVSGVTQLTNSSQLSDRIVVESAGVKYAYDPTLPNLNTSELPIGNYQPGKGYTFTIKLWSTSDLLGIWIYGLNDKIQPVKDTFNKIDLKIVGSLLYGTNITQISNLYKELSVIDNPSSFFKHYATTKYNIEGIFANLPRLLYTYPDVFYSLGDHNGTPYQTTMKSAYENCPLIKELEETFVSSNILHIDTVESMFENCTGLISNSKFFGNNSILNVINAKNMFKDCPNLIVNNSNRNLLGNNILKIQTMESFFENCISVEVPINLDTLHSCNNYFRMYKNCAKLDFTNKVMATIDSSKDALSNFGILSDNHFLPNTLPLGTINFKEMFYNCTKCNIYRRMYPNLPSNTLEITDMFYGCKSMFTDKFIFWNLIISGNSNVETITPEFIQTVRIDSTNVTVGHLLRYYGIHSSESAAVSVSKYNHIYYPEFSGSIEIDWGDGTIEKVNIISSTSFTDKISFTYRNVDSSGNPIEGNVELRVKNMNSITHNYTPDYIGKTVTVKFRNRIIPLAIVSGVTTSKIGGELPWSRLEMLDLSSLNTISEMEDSIFNNCWMSINTRVKTWKRTDSQPNSDNALFNSFSNLKILNNEMLFRNLINLRILGPICTNCFYLKEVYADMFYFNNRVVISEYSFAYNNNLRLAPYMPYNINSMYGTYSGTSVLNEPTRNPLFNLTSLELLCHTFEYNTLDNKEIKYNIFQYTPKLKRMLYTFMNSNINRIMYGFLSNMLNLEIARGVFANTDIDILWEPLFKHSTNLKDISYTLSGTKLPEYTYSLSAHPKLLSAEGFLSKCPNLVTIQDHILNTNNDLINVSHFASDCPNLANIGEMLFANKPNLANISYALYNCPKILAISNKIILNSINISNVSYAFARTGISATPDSIFITNTNIIFYNGVFSENINLVTLNDIKITAKNSNVTYLKEMFKGCINFNFGYHKFTDFITPVPNTSMPNLNVQDMLRNIESKYNDNEMADNKFTLIGLTNSLYRPDPSLDTYNMNMMQYDFTIDSIDDRGMSFYVYTGNSNTGMQQMTHINQLVHTNRLVVDIDGVKYGYDKSIRNDEIIDLTSLPIGTHRIKVYTEGVHNVPNDNTIDSDIVVLRQNVFEAFDIKLSGHMVCGPINPSTNVRSVSFSYMFGNTNIININDLDLTTTPTTYLCNGYFKDSNIIQIDLSKLPLRTAYMESLFEGSTKLTSVYVSTPLRFDIPENTNAKSMFKDCKSLHIFPDDYISNIFKNREITASEEIIILPISFESMFENCASLDLRPKVLSFVSTDTTRTLKYNSVILNEAIINMNNMYKNSVNIPTIYAPMIDISLDDYGSMSTSYLMESMFEASQGFVAIPYNALNLGRVGNNTTFKSMFKDCPKLLRINVPMLTMNWRWTDYSKENLVNVEYMFSNSTKLEWRRIKMRQLFLYEDTVNIPRGYDSYAMLQNIIAFNPDDVIMENYTYTNPTLAIYQNQGPDLDNLKPLTIIMELPRISSGGNSDFEHVFDLYGSANTSARYTKLTGLSTSLLYGRMVIVINNDNNQVIEYDNNVPKIIDLIRTETIYEDPNYQPRVQGNIMIRLDIYTEEFWEPQPTREFLVTARPTVESSLECIYLLNSLGHSDIMASKGLCLIDIFGTQAERKLISLTSDIFTRYKEFTAVQIPDYGTETYLYSYSLFYKLKGLQTLPVDILKPFAGMSEIKGIFVETIFEELPDNMLNGLSVVKFQDIFATTQIPKIGEEFLKSSTIEDITGIFYKSTRTTYIDQRILQHIDNLKIANYLYCESDLTVIYDDLFYYANKLEEVSYAFYKTNITLIPSSLFNNANALIKVMYTFYGTLITFIPIALLANKPNLEDVSFCFAECEYNTSIGLNLFQNSTGVKNVTGLFIHNIFKTFPSNIFVYCFNLEIIDRAFENCQLLEGISVSTFINNIKIKSAVAVFKNCLNIPEVPDNLFATLMLLENISEAFYGKGIITRIGNNVLPRTTTLKNASYMFYQQKFIQKLPDDFFIGLSGLIDIDSIVESCISFNELQPTLLQPLVNLAKINRSFYGCSGILSIPDKFIYNSPIVEAIETFAGCDGVTELGKSIFKISTSVSGNLKFHRTFQHCTGISLYFNYAEDYIENIGNNNIEVDSMFENVQTFYDETEVWKNIPNKIGDSKLTHIDPPSTDTTGMNELIVTINSNQNMNTIPIYLTEFSHAESIINNTNQLRSRVVIEVDGDKFAYDNVVYPNQEILPIIFDTRTVSHTIKIYTFEDDFIFLTGLYKDLDINATQSDIDNFRRTSDITLEISGTFPKSLETVSNVTLETMTIKYAQNITGQPVCYPIIKIAEDLLYNVTKLPRINNNIKLGFFSNLMITETPWKIFSGDVQSQQGVEYSILDGLFYHNIALTTFRETLFDALQNGIESASYTFAECYSLVHMPYILGQFYTMNKMEGLFEDDNNLVDLAGDWFYGKNNVNINRLFKNCVNLDLTQLERYMNMIGNIASMDYAFYGVPITSLDFIQSKVNSVTSMKYAFARTSITKVPENFFFTAELLVSSVDNSPIEGVFSDCPQLVSIEGNLGLTNKCQNIQEMFANSTNLNWGVKLFYKVVYKAKPVLILVEDSFKGVSIALDNQNQLFLGIDSITGDCKAIFTGRAPVSEDTTGLNEFIIKVTPNNVTDDISAVLYKYYDETETRVVEASSLDSRIVIKVYDNSNNLLYTHAYDKLVFDDVIQPLTFAHDKISVVHVYTTDEYIYFKGNDKMILELSGTLPKHAYNNGTLMSLYSLKEAFGASNNITLIAGTLLNNCPVTKLDLTNKPLQTNSLITIGNGIFDILTTQDNYDYQFSDSPELMNIPSDIFKASTITSLRYTFANCPKLNVNLTGFFDLLINLVTIKGIFAGTIIDNYPVDLLKNNIKLTDTSYAFENAKITSIPDNQFKHLESLVAMASMFYKNPLTKIPLLGLVPSCYGIERLFFGCATASIINLDFIDQFYGGTTPTTTVSLLDCLYQVKIAYPSEREFLARLPFRTGSTAATYVG